MCAAHEQRRKDRKARMARLVREARTDLWMRFRTTRLGWIVGWVILRGRFDDE